MSDFEGKVVVITGAGAGLGKAHALEFASRGAKVVVNDLGGAGDGTGSGDSADLVVEEIKAAGGEAIANKASVADTAGAQSIIDDAVNAYGTVDILVNNAGILRDKSFKKMTLDDWDMVMDVHINGTAYVTKAAWPIMYEKNYGRIVLTSSISGIFGNFGQTNYAAAKTGMIGMMNVLSIEGMSKNITVNVLAPSAETRLIGTVPGIEVNPDNPDPMRHPKLVTPVVLMMCAEDAPTGKTFHAGNGEFYRSATFVNPSIQFDRPDFTFEDLLERKDELLDMSSVREMNGMIWAEERRKKAEESQ
ncbi:MAG: SDR family NAD(P)-dependent oxidoreductase [Gammaproteobacteria bacterium]|nr:SDR family NAD(P)-dependent oxidoreductase [Gammaproteobacteria bacterium]